MIVMVRTHDYAHNKNNILLRLYGLSTVIMVDFTSTTLTATEGQGVSVCVTLLSGSVARTLPVMVGLSATDGTTRGTH